MEDDLLMCSNLIRHSCFFSSHLRLEGKAIKLMFHNAAVCLCSIFPHARCTHKARWRYFYTLNIITYKQIQTYLFKLRAEVEFHYSDEVTQIWAPCLKGWLFHSASLSGYYILQEASTCSRDNHLQRQQ